MPGVLIIEAMAQVGGVLAFKSAQQTGAKLVYFMGIEKAKFRKPVTPGDRLRFVVDVLRARHPYWKMRGEAFVDDALVCEAELMAMITDGVAAEESEP
jgi:3-hydroxymyristoyl/3-hydroxydecanoyl-(acyl carrier protein) dehydratase